MFAIVTRPPPDPHPERNHIHSYFAADGSTGPRESIGKRAGIDVRRESGHRRCHPAPRQSRGQTITPFQARPVRRVPLHGALVAPNAIPGPSSTASPSAERVYESDGSCGVSERLRQQRTTWRARAAPAQTRARGAHLRKLRSILRSRPISTRSRARYDSGRRAGRGRCAPRERRVTRRPARPQGEQSPEQHRARGQ